MLLASAAFLDIDSADVLDHYATSAPHATAHLLVSHSFDADWEGSVNIHHQSAFRADGNSQPQRAFSRVDLRIARNFLLGPGDAEIAATVENLFDSHYTELRQDDIAERRVWLTLRYKMRP